VTFTVDDQTVHNEPAVRLKVNRELSPLLPIPTRRADAPVRFPMPP